MENVIVIISDSLGYQENMLEDMPNLRKYKDNIISFNNYFSQAPFTEAATVPLYTASNVLDYHGYLNGIKGRPFNINRVFKTLGYKTYNTLWFYPNSYSYLEGLDEYDYLESGLTYSITVYRLEYFKELYRDEKFTASNMEMMIDLLDDFFKMSEIYVKDFYNNNHRFDLLTKYTDFAETDFDEFYKIELKNREEYLNDKELYIKKLLNGENTFFTKNNSKPKRSDEFNSKKTKINVSMMPTLIKQFSFAIKNNNKNNSLKILNYLLENKKDTSGYRVLRTWLSQVIGYPGQYAYHFLSAKVIMQRVFEQLYKNKDQKNFVITHLMDTHYPLNFVSSESQGIENEFSELKKYQKKFKKEANNVYRFSKLYVDEQIGTFIDNLEKNDMLENTTIVITSDHGSSFLGEVFREKSTTNFHEENYKIPFMIFNKNIKSMNNEHLSISTQFLPTLLDYLQVDGYDEFIEENSIFTNNQDHIIYEYFGPGCPDYVHKSKLFAIKNEKYKVTYESSPIHSNKPDQILAIYDLSNDPKELNNVKDYLIDNEDIKELVEALKKRLAKINY